jgi:hypothetical protein
MGTAMATREQMFERADKKLAELRSVKRWLATPKMSKILSSIDYLAEKYNAQVDSYIDSAYTSVYLTLKDLDGLKDESLAALLYSMEHHNASHQSTDDDAGSYARTYRYYWRDWGDSSIYHSLGIHITANFKSDSETCKRVVVGYTEPSKEPTPIYKLQCVDATDPAAV